jgi:oligoribonuclease (3'-5' exoribonuclease)
MPKLMEHLHYRIVGKLNLIELIGLTDIDLYAHRCQLCQGIYDVLDALTRLS